MAYGLTPQLPLTRDFVNGFFYITEYTELVKQNFKNLLLTNPGERVMDLSFGIGINRFLFNADSPQLYGDISAKIAEQIDKYLPYIEIVNETFESAALTDTVGPNTLSISLQYLIKPLQTIDTLDLTLSND